LKLLFAIYHIERFFPRVQTSSQRREEAFLSLICTLIDLHFPEWDYYFLKTRKEKNKRAINEYMPRESCGDDDDDDF